jgi:hypothetical protein
MVDKALNLYQKLIEVRKVVPYLQKDTQGYQYNYVSGATVLGKLKEIMDNLGLLLVPSVTNFVVGTLEMKEKGQIVSKNSVYANMTMTWINAENPEERFEVPFACFGAQDDIAKAFGSALTYSERYFLLKFFNIATDKDDPDAFQEKNNGGGNIQTPKTNKSNTAAGTFGKMNTERILAMTEKTPAVLGQILQQYGVEAVEQLDPNHKDEIIAKISELKKGVA